MRLLLTIGFCAVAMTAQAADGPWTPAPVPSIGDPTVLPAARVGPGVGASVVDAPFSSAPPSSIAGGGATSSNTLNTAQTPDLSAR